MLRAFATKSDAAVFLLLATEFANFLIIESDINSTDEPRARLVCHFLMKSTSPLLPFAKEVSGGVLKLSKKN